MLFVDIPMYWCCWISETFEMDLEADSYDASHTRGLDEQCQSRHVVSRSRTASSNEFVACQHYVDHFQTPNLGDLIVFLLTNHLVNQWYCVCAVHVFFLMCHSLGFVTSMWLSLSSRQPQGLWWSSHTSWKWLDSFEKSCSPPITSGW